MKILLHICCAPCAIHPLRELAGTGDNTITGFYYNPNIHPFTEWEKRRRALIDYAQSQKLDVIYGGYEIERFFGGLKGEFESPGRCLSCWRMRLAATACAAKEGGFDAYTTTLLVSPYQDRDTIVNIGKELSDEAGVVFLGEDYRTGFRQAQQLARERGMYRQKYCGCVFSERERFQKTRSSSG